MMMTARCQSVSSALIDNIKVIMLGLMFWKKWSLLGSASLLPKQMMCVILDFSRFGQSDFTAVEFSVLEKESAHTGNSRLVAGSATDCHVVCAKVITIQKQIKTISFTTTQEPNT